MLSVSAEHDKQSAIWQLSQCYVTLSFLFTLAMFEFIFYTNLLSRSILLISRDFLIAAFCLFSTSVPFLTSLNTSFYYTLTQCDVSAYHLLSTYLCVIFLLITYFLATGACLLDQFACADGSCIPLIDKCDGIADCTDMSDEVHCGMCREYSQCSQISCYRDCSKTIVILKMDTWRLLLRIILCCSKLVQWQPHLIAHVLNIHCSDQ